MHAMLKALAADAAEGAELTRLAAREGRADFNTGPSPPGGAAGPLAE